MFVFLFFSSLSWKLGNKGDFATQAYESRVLAVRYLTLTCTLYSLKHHIFFKFIYLLAFHCSKVKVRSNGIGEVLYLQISIIIYRTIVHRSHYTSTCLFIIGRLTFARSHLCLLCEQNVSARVTVPGQARNYIGFHV